jgi:23S rRNA (adenine2030-N6)-methyltransferase
MAEAAAYRHQRHAGNFADVHKHALLAWIVRRMASSGAPLRVLDTHAGDGLYRLERTRRPVLERLRTAVDAPDVSAPYLQVLGALPADDYPGSPWLLHRLTGPDDRLVFSETRPHALDALRARFGADPRVSVSGQDGWTVLSRWSGARTGRGLVLVDPPYVHVGDYQRVPAALREAERLRPGDCFCLWYPLLDGRHEAMLDALRAAFPGGVQAELRIRPGQSAGGMSGSGLFIVHPPDGLEDALGALQPWLRDRLAPAGGGSARVLRAPAS